MGLWVEEGGGRHGILCAGEEFEPLPALRGPTDLVRCHQEVSLRPQEGRGMMTYLRAKHRGEVKRQDATFDRLHRTHSKFIEFVEQKVEIGPTTRVVELGCGGGCFTAMLSERFRSYIEGWDMNRSFIAAARRRPPETRDNAGRRVFRRIGFFDGIPPDLCNSFDIAFFRETMMCVTGAIELLRWATQLLRENGSVAALEPDYGMTTIYPELPHWADFFAQYSHFCGAHDEDFLFGRSLLDVFQKADLKEISLLPFTELHTSLDPFALKHFLEVEARSIRQDMPHFVKETGYSADKVNKMLRAMKTLHRQPGAYVQTHMVGICGKL